MHRREAVFLLRKLLVAGGDAAACCALRACWPGTGSPYPLWDWFSGDEKTDGIRIGGGPALSLPLRSPGRARSHTHRPDAFASGGTLKARGGRSALLAGAGLEPFPEAPETGKSGSGCSCSESSPAFLSEMRTCPLRARWAQALGRTGDALPDMTVLVTGYGRFGRALAQKLKMLGADVWVAARREEQRLAARSDGMRAASLAELPALMGRVDMVLNTIPARVLGTDALAALPKDTWLLELASAPYGFDRCSCGAGPERRGSARAPARYAPQSAARALKQVSWNCSGRLRYEKDQHRVCHDGFLLHLRSGCSGMEALRCGADAGVLLKLSFNAGMLDTRFMTAEHLRARIVEITGNEPIDYIGWGRAYRPQEDDRRVLIAPATGNSLAKSWPPAFYDTPALLGAKSHLRNDRPGAGRVRNDGLGAAAQNIGRLLNVRKHLFRPLRPG